jgi:hypothetical protein
VGADNLLDMLEVAAVWGGAPRGFKLSRVKEDAGDQEVAANVTEAIQQAMAAMGKSIEEKVVKPIAGEMATDKQRLDQLTEEVKKLLPIFQLAQAGQAKDALAQQAEHRKDISVASKIKRDDAKAQADIAVLQQKTAGELQIAQQRAAGELQIKSIESAHGAAVKAATAPVPEPAKDN